MLTVRFGQLTVEGLSPSKIHSLAGCSQALATAAGSLGGHKQALQFSKHAVDIAKQAKIFDSDALLLHNAELNAQAGNYREDCNLAREENVKTRDALKLKILAVVLREYTQKHSLQLES